MQNKYKYDGSFFLPSQSVNTGTLQACIYSLDHTVSAAFHDTQ